jgi:hypothetical protein
MRKKINNKYLLAIFSILLVLVIILFTKTDGYKERSFDKQIVSFNSNEINKIVIYPKVLQGERVEIEKDEDEWQIKAEKGTYKAAQNSIEGMLNSLSDLIAMSLASNSKERWESFEVNDSLSTRVQLFNEKEKKVADVHIGKFKFSQPQSMSTYVRLEGKKETYRVNGFLSSMFNRQINDFRDKTLINDPTANWTRLIFDYPADSSFIINKEQGQWKIDGVIADQNEVSTYVNSIKNTNATSFHEDIELPPIPKYRLTIERENLSSVIIDVFNSDGEDIITGTENKEVLFTGQSIIERIFVPKSKFEINN